MSGQKQKEKGLRMGFNLVKKKITEKVNAELYKVKNVVSYA